MGGSWVRICQRSDSKQKEKIRSASSLISMAIGQGGGQVQISLLQMLRGTAWSANNNVWKFFEKWSHNRHCLHPMSNTLTTPWQELVRAARTSVVCLVSFLLGHRLQPRTACFAVASPQPKTPTSRKQVLALHDELDHPLLDEGVLSSSSVI